MRSLLFYDTETTGFAKSLPDDHPDQPHLVQIAALLMLEDGTELASLNLLIRTEMWIIGAGAIQAHGITAAKADAYGVKERWAVATFLSLAEKADLLIAHNEKFDARIIDIAKARYAVPVRLDNARFCTCEEAAGMVNLPPTEKMLRAGFTKAKAPTLTECHEFFFGEKFGDAHDALADTRACARVYFELIRRRNNNGQAA